MEFELPKVPTISGDAFDYLVGELSIDSQLKRGLLDSHHHSSEAFKLGLLAGLSESMRVVERMYHTDDL